MYFSRIFEIIDFQLERYPQEVSFAHFSNNELKKISTKELVEKSNQLALGLLSLGLKKGDYVILYAQFGTFWWVALDIALQRLGVIVIPLHSSATDEQLHYIFEETEAKYCFVFHESQVLKLQQLMETKEIQSVSVISMKKNGTSINRSTILEHGRQQKMELLQPISETIGSDDVVTIIYTSGTIGKPKGVQLTHKNIISNILSVLSLLPVDAHQKAISFLPLSHIFERMVLYTYMAAGISVHFVRPNEMKERLPEVQPHIMTCVPRFLEVSFEKIMERVQSGNFLEKWIARWAIRVGEHYPLSGKVSWWYSFQLFFAKMLFFTPIKRTFGKNLEFVLVGAAALQTRLALLFSAAGLKIREGYGLTETSPVLAFNRFEPGSVLFGTVGIPIPSVEIKINEPDESGQGEIWAKGPNVMKGYFKNSALTQEVLTTDGWFKTGDIGQFINHRFLKITDRKKDIFKTSSGKYVSPLTLENRLKESPFVSQCLVYGAGKPMVIAIIIPNFSRLQEWAEAHQVHWTAPMYMIHNPEVMEFYENEIKHLNEGLEKHERIRKFILSADEWTIENELLTVTMKPKRTLILDKYEKEVEKLYYP